jgi:hypothetical protein
MSTLLDAAMTSMFHIDCQERGASEVQRSANTHGPTSLLFER